MRSCDKALDSEIDGYIELTILYLVVRHKANSVLPARCYGTVCVNKVLKLLS